MRAEVPNLSRIVSAQQRVETSNKLYTSHDRYYAQGEVLQEYEQCHGACSHSLMAIKG